MTLNVSDQTMDKLSENEWNSIFFMPSNRETKTWGLEAFKISLNATLTIGNMFVLFVCLFGSDQKSQGGKGPPTSVNQSAAHMAISSPGKPQASKSE